MSDATATSSQIEPEENPPNIDCLEMGREDNVLEARIYRKWVCRGSPPIFCCMLIDRKGNAIQGNMAYNHMNHFNSKFYLNRAYTVTKFTVEPTRKYQQTLQNNISLRFGLRTDFDILTGKESEFPEHHFEFLAHNQLSSRIPYIDEQTRQKVYPILTDFLGRLRSISDVTPFGNPTVGQSYRRQLQIENLDGSTIEFTMWDELATSFDQGILQTASFPAIIAVTSCRVSMYRDSPQLSSTTATHYYVNIKIPEFADARRMFLEKYNVAPPLQVTDYPYADIEQEKARNRQSLRSLLQQDPANYKTIRFTCEAVITSINSTRSWNYLSCKDCNKASTILDGIPICDDHGRQLPPPYKYNFKAKMTDATATAEFTFFNKAGRKVTGHDCEDVRRNFKQTPQQQIPSEIANIIGKRHIFQIQFATNSQKGAGRFTVNDVLDIPDPTTTNNNIGATTSVAGEQNEDTEAFPLTQETDEYNPDAPDVQNSPADTEDQPNVVPGTPPHDVIDTVVATLTSTIPNQKIAEEKAKATSSKRSLNTVMSADAKKKKDA